MMSEMDEKLLAGLSLADTAHSSSSGSTSNTGPKGVLADYKEYQSNLARAREEQEASFAEKISKQALSSGWMSRQIESEKFSDRQEDDEEEDVDELIRQLEDEDTKESESTFSRLIELTQKEIAKHKPKFGKVVDIPDEMTYLSILETTSPEVVVCVHLRIPHSTGCRLVSEYFQFLANVYPNTLFIDYEPNKQDLNIPRDLYPVILGYKGGVAFANLVGWTRDLSGGGGYFECDDLETVLLKAKVIDERDRRE